MYTIIETQTNGDSMAVVTPAVEADKDQAESIYHARLASAAISSVEIHSVVLLNAEGQRVKGECYKHQAQA